MSRPPEVSVVIPTYRRRDPVRRAVASVLAQTYRDFEIVVADCGSADGTREALAPLTGERFRFIDVGRPGVSVARNAALHAARGRIVAFLDSDNYWFQDHLGTLVALLERHPEAVVASVCPSFVVGGRQELRRARVAQPLPLLLVANQVGFMSCAAVRADALRRAGGFDERLVVGEDTDLWIRLALLGPFVTLRRRTLFVEMSPDSLRERGRRTGLYLDMHELSGTRLVQKLEREPGREELAAKARGAHHFAAALRALDRHDAGAAGAELASACRLLPELSREPALVAGRIEYNLTRGYDRLERLRAFELASTVWPHPDSDTAVGLRVLAVVLAVRSRRFATAARLAVGVRPLRPVGILARQRSVLADYIRRKTIGRAALRPRGEAADLGTGGHVSDDDGAGGDRR